MEAHVSVNSLRLVRRLTFRAVAVHTSGFSSAVNTTSGQIRRMISLCSSSFLTGVKNRSLALSNL